MQIFKKVNVILVFALIIIATLVGCSVEEPGETSFGWSLYDENKEKGIPMETFTDNLELEYVKLSYEGIQFADSSVDCWADAYFLTSDSKLLSDKVTAYELRVKSLEELNQLRDLVQSKKSACLGQVDNYQEPQIEINTLQLEIDEAFFESYHLYIVDICVKHNPFFRSRLDSLSVDSSTLTISVLYETVHGYTADVPGEVYLIPIPADCSKVELLLSETAWEHGK